MKINTQFYSILHLFYPVCCQACGKALLRGEEVICTFCLYHLPRTNFHTYRGNAVEKKFWGKVNIKSATAYFYFSKGQRVQKLIHHLKYSGAREIGAFVGNLIGNDLKQSDWFNSADAVIPVPLHFSRIRTRGYNQSELLADAIAQCLGCPVETELLYRAVKTETQTKKHRYERWENVGSVFQIKPGVFRGYRHILLIDDVITTGSTLAACAETLIQGTGAQISIAAMAVA
ncbi:MAG: ComF family protein [Bacteroidia bacterium]|nr:ComF family protein [Bacteroidia bacterium]MCZ2276441.1 ComF family protein [Bacteroidia bacterium]